MTIRIAEGSGSGIDHWHQRVEFVYVIQGECLIKAGKEQRLCGPGDLAVIRSGEIHSLGGDSRRMVYIATFDPGMFYHFLPEGCFPRSFISAEEQSSAGLDGEIRNLLQEIYREKSAQEPLHEPLIRAGILRLYSLLLRHFADHSPKDQKALERLQQFQAALEFIAAHYAEHITLADVARAISYTPSYVSTLFVTCGGVNFKAYLDDYRIKKAVDLLCATPQTVTDIALQCGYDNVRTFNNAFRRVTGQSPRQLRRANM